MDFLTWIAHALDQQPDPTPTHALEVTAGPQPGTVNVTAPDEADVLELPPWSPGPSEIPQLRVTPDAKELDAYGIFGAGLHDSFTKDELGRAFNAAYVGSYTDCTIDWGDGYDVVASDTMAGVCHVFKSAPQTVDLEQTDAMGWEEMKTTPPQAADDAQPWSMPAPAAKPAKSATAKTTTAKQTKPKTVKRTQPATSPQTAATAASSAPVGSSTKAAAQAAQTPITSRSPLFRPWAQAAQAGTLH